MKAVISGIFAVLMLLPSVASAQNLAGTWQGTLSVGKDLRLVFTISNATGGGLTAVMYSIDQAGQGMSVSTITQQDSTLKMAIAAIDGTFDGEISQDGTSITGNWAQGGRSVPLKLTRATADSAWPIPAPPKPMAADAAMVFEVATIKPSNPDVPGKLITVRGRQFSTVNTTVNDLVSFAYGLHARQITGGPAWMETEKYDVTAQPEAQGTPNQAQLRAMVLKLLADRFHLTVHRETKELPVYAIVLAKGGSGLSKNETNPNGLPSLLFKGLGVLPAVNASMADLASVMQAAVLDRPVVDKTGLPGRYDFTLTWTPDESQFRGLGIRVPAPSTDPNAPPGLFSAIQEQLGLKLESSDAPVEVLVVERVEKPSDN